MIILRTIIIAKDVGIGLRIGKTLQNCKPFQIGEGVYLIDSYFIYRHTNSSMTDLMHGAPHSLLPHKYNSFFKMLLILAEHSISRDFPLWSPIGSQDSSNHAPV